MRRAWRLRREGDWRAFVGAEVPWLAYDAVIIGGSGHGKATRPRRQSYEVYLRGDLVATRPRLDEAKAYVEEAVGRALTWRTGRTEPVEVHHRHFGPTTEFSAPSTYWFAEDL
jgi:hypothetical protein